MSRRDASPTITSTTTAVTEETWFRAYNRNWWDTAFGRSRHYATCPLAAHRTCRGTS